MAHKASKGDRAPDLSTKGIERFEIGQASDSAQGELVNAVRDVLQGAHPGDVQGLQASLTARTRSQMESMSLAESPGWFGSWNAHSWMRSATGSGVTP